MIIQITGGFGTVMLDQVKSMYAVHPRIGAELPSGILAASDCF